jgi:hypothetical protein
MMRSIRRASVRKGLVLIVIVITVAATQLPGQVLSDAEVLDLTGKVQNISANELDRSLPREPFAEWLRLQMPRDARFGWAVRMPGEETRNELTEMMPWVEVDVSRDGHPLLVIYISCKNAPTVQSINVIMGRDVIEISRLQDIRASVAE